VRQVSATEAARRFSEVLDSVEGERESFVVVRRGRAVATIGPATGATGRDLKNVLRDHRPDAAWAGELRELRDSIGSETDPWHA
jgi:antitoxin (DNA-binding transcriptional repressor) of toxin-antitoxin stability system